MTPAKLHRTPRIGQRLLVLSLLCAIIPLCLFGLLAAMTQGSHTFEPVTTTIGASASNQLQLGVKANANRISSRMGQISYSVKQLKHFAQEVLGNQAFYGGAIPGPTDPGEDQPLFEAPLDNTLYYSTGDDGAIRRLVDDGSPSAFFSERRFTPHDMQKLYASAALDPLLIAPAQDEPLCGRTFFITYDNLVRTYPYYNFSHWDGSAELSKPRDYWSQAKAGEDGIVWTSPYQSLFDEQWVVACLAQVTLGGRAMGVAGCEIPLKPMADDLLVFSLGTGGMAWIVKPGAPGEDQGWWTLSTQPGAEDFLRVVPVAAAALPTDKHPQSEILVEADLAIHSPAAISGNLGSIRGGTDQAIEVSDLNGGQLLSSFPVETTGWLLCGTISNDANRAALAYSITLQNSFFEKVRLFILCLIVAIGFAGFLAILESRKISQPLALLAQLVEKAKSDPHVSLTQFSELSEVNTLTSAIKDLVEARDLPVSPAVDENTPEEPTQIAEPEEPSIDPPEEPSSDPTLPPLE